MQIDDMLLLRMNRQYLFTPAEDELTVLRGLCGLQAQFYGNCLHALRLRCGKAPDEDILRTSAVKTWTLRGTLHLIAQSDLPLFLYNGRSHFLRPCDTMENDDHLSAARKRELAAIILDAAQKGCGGREELRLLCREHGMTADEEQSAFDPWGGLLRALCESGVLCHTAQQKKAFRPCPPFDPITRDDALRELLHRYLTHYGPVTVQDAAYFFGLPQRELLRQVGENARREIYISWDTSVANACRRYEVVLDNFRRGLYPPRDTRVDELLLDTAESLDAINRLRAIPQQLRAAMDEDVRQWHDEIQENRLNAQENRQKLQEKLSQLRQQIDRYL